MTKNMQSNMQNITRNMQNNMQNMTKNMQNNMQNVQKICQKYASPFGICRILTGLYSA